ncbi:MAG: MATE family efflux transporter [Defluviitaleaceae bacterium]|nr:MATE family efflux transporter [Defluviitaleaceae bacterium]
MTRAEIQTRAKELFGISIPLAMELLAISVMGMISTMLVSSINEYAVSAVGMVDSVSNLVIALFAALTTGGTIVVAQYIGREDGISAKRAGGQALILAVLFSLVATLAMLIFRQQVLALLFGDAADEVMEAAFTFLTIVLFSFPVLAATQTAFGILRGSGDTFTPMVVSVLMNVVNLVLGFTLIRGLDLGFISIPSFGVAGAAVALLIARVMGLVGVMLFLIFKAKRVKLNRIKYFKPDFPMQKTILTFGVPTSFEQGLFQAGRLIQQTFVVTISTAAIATNTIANSLIMFVNVPGMALSSGIMILVGQRIGRGQYDDVKRTTLFAAGMSSVLFAVLGAAIFIMRNPIFALFSPSPEALELLPLVFGSYLLATPLIWSISFIIPSALRATGDVLFTMIISISTMLILRVVLSYIFIIVLDWGVFGGWLAMYIDWVGRSIFFLPRLISGKWRGKGIKQQE